MINPSEEILSQSYIKDYEELYKQAKEHPESFWENIARDLYWFKPWDKVLDWQYPYARWFVGAETNIVYNALDRHQKTETKNKLALIWEGQNGQVKRFTYGELNEAVCRFANVLKTLGIRKGDRVCLYLPRTPEQMICMLACAKIGAIHTVVYSGLSVEALKNRVLDEEATIIITTNSYYFREKLLETKKIVNEAIKDIPTVKNIIVVRRTDVPTDMIEGRDLWFDELCQKADTICSTEIMKSEDPLFILYTSGTTGKPKGIIHSHGGYMVGVYITLKWIMNIQSDDIYWCTADPGWITGHSYIVYSPLINGLTVFLYEGPPDFPDNGRWWSLIEKYKVTKFYTTPTAIRSLMRFGDEVPKKYNFSSLKILGSVGEPINPEAWLWFYKNIGYEKCPIMDTWWQTESGMYIISPFPSVPLKPGSAFKPFPGIITDVVDETGKPVPVDTQGFLIIKNPWPAMFMDVYKNPERYKETYFEKIKNNDTKMPVFRDLGGAESDVRRASTPTEQKNMASSINNFTYFTGDSAKIDKDGYYWITGRNDDVLKVSGYRFGSAELESAFVAHPAVAEAAVIGKPHEIKGESIKAFIILKIGHQPTEELKQELKLQVRKLIGVIATPDEIEFVTTLPKTRSGKIMRRVLKAQELGQPVGDISTLEN